MILSGRFVPCVAVGDEESSQCLGLTVSDDLLCRQESLVINHRFWGHPAELVTKVGYVIKFTAAENNSRGEVDNFLESVKVFLGAISVNRETVLYSRDHKGGDDCLEDSIGEAISRMGKANQHAHASAAEFSHMRFPGQGAVEHDAQVPHL